MTESQQFLLSAFLALLIEFSVLGILGHKRQIQQEPAFFAETELLEMPKKLVSNVLGLHNSSCQIVHVEKVDVHMF